MCVIVNKRLSFVCGDFSISEILQCKHKKLSLSGWTEVGLLSKSSKFIDDGINDRILKEGISVHTGLGQHKQILNLRIRPAVQKEKQLSTSHGGIRYILHHPSGRLPF